MNKDVWDMLAPEPGKVEEPELPPPQANAHAQPAPAPQGHPKAMTFLVGIGCCLASLATAWLWNVPDKWDKLKTLDSKYMSSMPWQAQKLLAQAHAMKMGEAAMEKEKPNLLVDVVAAGETIPSAKLIAKADIDGVYRNFALNLLGKAKDYAMARSGQGLRDGNYDGHHADCSYAARMNPGDIDPQEMALFMHQLDMAIYTAERGGVVGDPENSWKSFCDDPETKIVSQYHMEFGIWAVSLTAAIALGFVFLARTVMVIG